MLRRLFLGRPSGRVTEKIGMFFLGKSRLKR
jgi:hypothetical protein